MSDKQLIWDPAFADWHQRGTPSDKEAAAWLAERDGHDCPCSQVSLSYDGSGSLYAESERPTSFRISEVEGDLYRVACQSCQRDIPLPVKP